MRVRCGQSDPGRNTGSYCLWLGRNGDQEFEEQFGELHEPNDSMESLADMDPTRSQWGRRRTIKVGKTIQAGNWLFMGDQQNMDFGISHSDMEFRCLFLLLWGHVNVLCAQFCC